YAQLKAIPRISVATLLEDTHHSLRINATVEECKDPARYKEYAKGNPGTMKMYRFNTDLIVLFKLVRGYGEIFHLYRDDMVRRLRFGFGGETPPELSYYITDECTGCGACFDSCAEHSIYRTDDGKYHIRSMDCDDCGICYTRCPLAGTALKNRYWE
ncbi:MAG: ferredoxin family protein, partial [Clostridiales bacterium]|nr:ferredoxin family protein [Clostridiales bacterium]